MLNGQKRHLFGVCCLLGISVAQADITPKGLPESNVEVNQVAQEALIIHHNGTQTMVWSVDYQASATPDGLVWVVPVPNPPDAETLERKNFSLFPDLEAWVKPAWQSSNKSSRSSQRPRLSFKRQRTVGAYNIHSIDSRGEEAGLALNEWMVVNGYERIPSGSLDYYIQRDWSFVVVHFDPVSNIPVKGRLAPLLMRFSSATAVMPLKLSGPSGTHPVRLYLITDDPKDESAFQFATDHEFWVAASANQDFLPRDDDGSGQLTVAVETFAFSAAPAPLQEVLKVAGKWTHEEESLELRYILNPAFGRAPMMATIWEEDLSIPALSPPLVVETPPAEPVATTTPEVTSNDASAEEDSFFGCQMSIVAHPKSFGWGLLALLFTVLRRSRVFDVA